MQGPHHLACAQTMGVDRLPKGRHQPFYQVLVDERDRPGGMVTYVAQVSGCDEIYRAEAAEHSGKSGLDSRSEIAGKHHSSERGRGGHGGGVACCPPPGVLRSHTHAYSAHFSVQLPNERTGPGRRYLRCLKASMLLHESISPAPSWSRCTQIRWKREVQRVVGAKRVGARL